MIASLDQRDSVGLMYKTGTLEVTSDVRSKPLGPKRGRGRPKKTGHCLTITPPREVRQEVIPTAQYHERSPELRTISLPRVSPPTLTLADVDIENIEIIIENPEEVVVAEEEVVLPRRSKRKRGLVEELIVDNCNKKTRRRNKK